MNHSPKLLPRPALGKLIGGALVVVAVAFFTLTCLWMLQQPREYKLLDHHLGAKAWDPAALVVVLGWEYQPDNNNPYGLGHPDFFDVKHQALLRLLDLQKQAFGRSALARRKNGVFVDSSFARIASRSESEIVVLGTGTFEPCH
jgi:hypothetical protein